MLGTVGAESFGYRPLLGVVRSLSFSKHVWDCNYLHIQILTIEDCQADYRK